MLGSDFPAFPAQKAELQLHFWDKAVPCCPRSATRRWRRRRKPAERGDTRRKRREGIISEQGLATPCECDLAKPCECDLASGHAAARDDLKKQWKLC